MAPQPPRSPSAPPDHPHTTRTCAAKTGTLKPSEKIHKIIRQPEPKRLRVNTTPCAPPACRLTSFGTAPLAISVPRESVHMFQKLEKSILRCAKLPNSFPHPFGTHEAPRTHSHSTFSLRHLVQRSADDTHAAVLIPDPTLCSVGNRQCGVTC